MKSIFNTSNYYIIRAPLLPVSIYKNYLKNDEIDYSSFFKNKIIEETIMTTTYHLYKSLTKISYDSETKKARNAKESFLKYLIRMSTRGTPYGLLSGISLGQFDEKPNIQIQEDINYYYKSVKIDGSWLCKLIHFLERNYDYYQDSLVIWNERNYITEQRIYLDNQTCLIQENNKERVSIKNNDLLKFIKQNLHEDLTFKDLIKLISEKFLIEDENEIKRFIQSLLDKEIIFTSLRTALKKENLLDYLLCLYRDVNNDFIRSLQLIHFEIMKYQIMEIGEGKTTFLRIRELMSGLFKAKEYIQIDTKIQTKNNYLSNEIAENISEAAYLLWLLSPNDLEISTNNDFHYNFLEKYGLEQIVNLKELLSDINGMGYSTNEDKPIKNDIPFLKDKYYYALSHNEEIEITEKELLDLEKKNTVPVERAPLTTEIYSEFYYGNMINGYDEFLVISPIVSSFNAGATMGRFSQEIDRDLRSQLDNEIYEQYLQYSNKNDTEVIHINEIPKYARNLNINHSGTTQFKELDLDMPYNSFVLDDLFVGSTFDQLYLFSKTLNSRVIFITHSMLNYVLCSNLYRFLREVSIGNTRFIQPIKDNGIEGFNYCPRIRYKNVILKPATWKLNKDMYTSSEKENWIEQFRKIQQYYNIPNDVTMAYGDNRLTIDLSNYAHISILKKEIEKQGRLSLLEDFISKSNNDRVIEIVTPIYRKVKPNEKRISIPKNIYKRLETKRKWFSIHLYIDENYQNDFIIQHILPCLRELLDNNHVESFFFIKYKENEHFIKLRLLSKQNNSMHLYYDMLQRKQKWLNESELSNSAIVDYQPEFNRYGGIETIEVIEDYFMYDSWLAIQIIDQTFNYPKEFIVAISLIFLVNEL